MKDFLKYEFIKNCYPNNPKIDENNELIRDKLRCHQFKFFEKLNKHLDILTDF